MAKKNFRSSVRPAWLAALALLSVSSSVASESPPSDSVHVDTTIELDNSQTEPVVDTVLFNPVYEVSAARRVTNPVDLEQHLHQQPTVALVKSAIIPGWGQLGNHSYFKAVLFAGLETWFVSSAVHYGRQAKDARRNYESSTELSARQDWYYLYDNKRKNRNKFAWFAGLTIFISMFDAYVDAHLSGSPADSRNDKFSIEIAPVHDGGMAARLSLRF